MTVLSVSVVRGWRVTRSRWKPGAIPASQTPFNRRASFSLALSAARA